MNDICSNDRKKTINISSRIKKNEREKLMNNTLEVQVKTYGQSMMRKREEGIISSSNMYRHWPCSVLFFYHHSSLSTCRDAKERKKKGSKVKQIFLFFFSFFSHSLYLNDIRSNTLNTYIYFSLYLGDLKKQEKMKTKKFDFHFDSIE
jgi:hypothetical protein